MKSHIGSSLEDIQAAHLAMLEARREELRRQFDEVQTELTNVNEAIAVIRRMATSAPAEPQRPAIMVEAEQFKGMKTPAALTRLMLGTPQPYSKVELANALVRGGMQGDPERIRENVGDTLKIWRRRNYTRYDEADNAWSLTPLGRDALGQTNEREPPSERSLFAQPA